MARILGALALVSVLALALSVGVSAAIDPGQRIVIVSPARLLVGPWQVPLFTSAAELEVFLGGGRECPGGRLRVELPALAATAILDDASGVGCRFSPPIARVLGLVLRGAWRTDAGVRVGSTLATVRAAYPAAHPVRRSAGLQQPGWWDSGLPFVRLPGAIEAFNCSAVELVGFPCAQLAFQVVHGRVAAFSVRTGFGVG